MEIQVLVPSPGESIQEVVLARWLVKNGSFVEKDTELAEIESDKATLTLVAETAGYVHFLVEEGAKISVGSVACVIKTDQTANTQASEPSKPVSEKNVSTSIEEKKEPKITPLAKKIIESEGINIQQIPHSETKRITSEQVKTIIHQQNEQPQNLERAESRQELTPLRKKLSERLLQAKNATAMLTTFNEIDMSVLIEIRQQYKDSFYAKHGVKLGFMAFFAKAATIALQEFPIVNTRLDNETLVYYHYVDLGIAVQTEKGLVVPVIRNAQQKSHPLIEKEIFILAEKARTKKISIAELEGGTFSITNGGVFGSLLATPLLNYPQTAILGMHAIQERPVALNGQVVIKPMMYVALSYDHRVLDGRDSILFLKRIKELLEKPVQMFETKSVESFLEL